MQHCLSASFEPTAERTGQARTPPEQRAGRSNELTRSPIIDVTIAQVKRGGRILDQDRQLAIHHEASRGQGLFARILGH
jgi:hypothetical protein